jgi:hypothetical protein
VNKVIEDIPTNLYKYLSSDRTSEVLEKLLIRFSQVSVLNISLHCHPGIFETIFSFTSSALLVAQ